MRNGTRLANHLRTKRLSIRDAATQLDVTPSRVHDWMRGVAPRLETRSRIEAWSEGAVPASAWE